MVNLKHGKIVSISKRVKITLYPVMSKFEYLLQLKESLHSRRRVLVDFQEGMPANILLNGRHDLPSKIIFQ